MPGKGGGACGFLIENPRGGGVLPGGGGAKGREGVWREFGGGKAKYFFGAEIPTKKRRFPAQDPKRSQTRTNASKTQTKANRHKITFCAPPFCGSPKLRGRQVGNGMGGGRNGCFWETGRIQFRRARLEAPSSVSFSVLTEFREEISVSSSQPLICVQNGTHRVSRRTQ